MKLGSENRNSFIALVLAILFVGTGTYNAVVINSESAISSDGVKFVKRLDEIYGVTVPGRDVAASVSWKKLATAKKPIKREIISQIVTTKSAAPAQFGATTEESTPTAAVQEELSLSLIEVINQKKWQNGLKTDQFTGSLVANNGIIEELSVSLPNGEGLSVSFSEMAGNVFEYDMNGDLYSGMMYQVDQHAYMVTLTSGPLEGTRLRFSAPVTNSSQDALVGMNVDTGSFGNNSEQYGNNADQYGNTGSAPEQTQVLAQAQEVASETSFQNEEQSFNSEEAAQNDQHLQHDAVQAQSFNLEQT